MKPAISKRLGLSMAIAISLFPASAFAEKGKLQPADPSMAGTSLSFAAKQALSLGALPMGPADIKAKDAANREARTTGQARSDEPETSLAAGGTGAGLPKASIAGHKFQGRSDASVSPPSMSGAIGETRYVQAVNNKVGIYDRSDMLVGKGTLNQLAGVGGSVKAFDPQVIWDGQTQRFYYVLNAVFSASNNRLAFGFSKTASPSNATTDWCHYTYPYGDEFPGFPRLGDSRDFVIIGVNTYTGNQATYLGSDLVAIAKPPSGSSCPDASTFETGEKLTLRDGNNAKTFSPVPANEIDQSGTGYVVARNGSLPSNRLWFYRVVRKSSGAPKFSGPGSLTVADYALPPDAPAGENSSRLLTTLDARPTQAVVAVNPQRGTLSFWLQHTIRHASQSRAIVRWYEVDPVGPTLLRQGEIGNSSASGTNIFNAAISPDRRLTSSKKQFGDSFVIGYSVSRGGSSGINPRLVMGSSVKGKLVGNFVNVKNSSGPYVDLTCPDPGDRCRWGDSSSASPDPLKASGSAKRGVVWFTNEFGNGGTATSKANWKTLIWAAKP